MNLNVTLPAGALRLDFSNLSAPLGSADLSTVLPPPPLVSVVVVSVVAGSVAAGAVVVSLLSSPPQAANPKTANAQMTISSGKRLMNTPFLAGIDATRQLPPCPGTLPRAGPSRSHPRPAEQFSAH